MRDQLPRGYDAWKTRSQEDQDEDEQAQRDRAERDQERADDEYDRRKDEAFDE